MNALTGARVLVTGAASGIGKAVADTFASNGWKVCGLDRQPAAPGSTADDWILCDLADASALDQAITALAHQRWTALVNCAGVAGVGDPLRVLRINFIACRRITDAMAPRIADGGAIVHVSSGAAMRWPERQDILYPILRAEDAEALRLSSLTVQSPAEAYQLSKELLCLYGLSSCLKEMNRAVRTNVVSPGGVDTPLTPEFERSMGPDAMKFSLSITKRHASAQEVAAVVFFLASPQASWVNGAEIRVDGGLTAALTTGIAQFPAWR